MKTFTEDEVHTACCIWEAMLEQKAFDLDSDFNEYWDNNGSCTMRQHAVELVEFVEKVYKAIPAETREDHCFDWDIVPLILSRVEWVGPGPELPDVFLTSRGVNTKLKNL